MHFWPCYTAKSLRGIIKVQVAVHHCRSDGELRRAVGTGFHHYYASNTWAYVTQNMAAHHSVCLEHNSAYEDPHDVQ